MVCGRCNSARCVRQCSSKSVSRAESRRTTAAATSSPQVACGTPNVTASSTAFCFSSRRRHTRWTGDWSSDVCSSDLNGLTTAEGKEFQVGERKGQKAAEPKPAADSAVLAEWKSSETVCEWARLSPKLVGLDRKSVG